MGEHWKKGDSKDPLPWWVNVLLWILAVIFVIIGVGYPMVYGG